MIQITAYHGSRNKFNKFSLKYFGQSDAGMWGKGVYFTDKKEIASNWGNYIYKCKLTFNKPFVVEDGEIEKIDYFLSLGENNHESTKKLKEMGYDGVISYNENWYTKDGPIRGNQYVVFDPDTIEILGIENLEIPTNEKLSYHWDNKESIYVIEIWNGNDKPIETHYALDRNELNETINNLKIKFNTAKNEIHIPNRGNCNKNN